MAVLLVVLSCSAWSRVIYVNRAAPAGGDGSAWPSAFRTITAAVAAAVDGDEIWVARGIYAERLSLTKPLELYGGFAGTESRRSQRNWKANPTTVNALGGGTVFTVTESSRIDGFRITGGTSGEVAGGVTCTARGKITGTTTTLANCQLDSNTGQYGGAINCAEDRLALSNCTLLNNTSATNGGAIYAFNSCLTLADCLVDGNVAGNEGGGIIGRASWTGGTRTTDCTIVGTTITANRSNGAGGGILMTGEMHGRVNCIVERCYIARNQAATGAGLRLLGLCQIRDCLIVDNTAGAIGGAFDCYEAVVRIDGCTVAQNTAVQTGAISNWRGRFLVYNSIVYDNGSVPIAGDNISVHYSCIEGKYPGEEGTIYANPAFVAPAAGNFRLGPLSPCIDAGTNAELSPSQTMDFDGHARVADGDRDGQAVVDMGCYEADYWIDLAVRDFAVSPASINPGERIPFAGRVVNRGNQPTTGSFWIEFLCSTRANLGRPWYYLCSSVLVTNSIPAGGAVDLTRVVRTLEAWPSGPPDGRYYLWIRVDPLDEVAERDETNNLSWMPAHQLCVGLGPTETAPSWVLYR